MSEENTAENKATTKKKIKKALIIALCVVGALLLIVLIYAVYMFASYSRLGDMELKVETGAKTEALAAGQEYKLVSYNIGFGAYESDYGFFMDGGTESWAWSKERLDANMKNIAQKLKEENADLYIIQEVDTDSTRSYHYDERIYLTDALTDMDYTFASNWDSPFLAYPFNQPHGFVHAGIMTFSRANVTKAERYELPVEDSVSKLIDLDRCYTKSCIKVEGGKQLVLYNFHLSAYTSDGTIATEQLKLVLADMKKEYENGSYCIAGGDFNKDILGDSSVYFGKSDIEYSWAQPIPEGLLDEYGVTMVAPLDKEHPVPSCRNADGAYHKGQYVLTIDGFMVSPNVTVKNSEVIDTGFAYSDHNPVRMTFVLE